MAQPDTDQRSFTRVALGLPVEVHQGGSVWHQQLIDISLSGVATDQPDVWDAQYNEPFTLIIDVEEGARVELHAYLQHVEAGRLGFSVENVDAANRKALENILEAHMDLAILHEELQQLED